MYTYEFLCCSFRAFRALLSGTCSIKFKVAKLFLFYLVMKITETKVHQGRNLVILLWQVDSEIEAVYLQPP